MSVTEAETLEIDLDQPTGLWREAGKRLRRNKAAMIGAAIVIAFILLAIFAPLIAGGSVACCEGAFDAELFWHALDT